MYGDRKVRGKEDEKQVVCKILMTVYTNISFINGKKELKALRNNCRDTVISQVCK